MTKELETIAGAVLFGVDTTLPTPCRATHQCVQAGGCPQCFAPMLAESQRRVRFAMEAYEEYSDRLADELMFGTPRPKPN